MGETTRRIRASGGRARRITVDGPARVTALCDGYLDLDLSRFPDVARGIGDDLAIADGQDLNDMSISVNAFLLELPGRLALVDAGDSNRRGDSLGHLLPALKAAGYDPEDISDLLLTHLHGDHAAGLVKGGERLFPKATLHVSAVEQAFWNDPAQLDELQSVQLPFAQAAMRLYADRLVTIHPGDEVLPGVVARALPGHTPGQVGFQMGDQNPLLISADVLHLPALQVRFPNWGFLFDADRHRSRVMRHEILAETVRTGLRLAGAHIPFPGVIRVVGGPEGLGFRTAEDEV